MVPLSNTFHVRTGLLTGMPRRHQDMWSRSQLLEAMRRRRGTQVGADGTLAAPASAARRRTISADCTGRILEAAKDNKQQERSFTPTNKKNTEANTKVHDLNQRTMQALNNLAIVFATFAQAGAPMGDLLCADVRAAMEDFNEDQQNQERMQGELKDSHESLDSAFAEFKEANRNHRNKKESRRYPRPNQN